ncbi:RDD family protein [Nonomuraea sp. ZG12]|uniref:RDD family protein n=1 Tax=Nonomuraea sp. ZG12 TaxID=3452207 RepID=UPI003F8CCC15
MIYGMVRLFPRSTLSPFAPLRSDLTVVLDFAVKRAGPAFVVLLGLLVCVGRGDSEATGRRVAGLADYVIAVGVLGVVVFGLFLYFWGSHALGGRTVGKLLLGVRVVGAGTGGRLGVGRAALRALAFPLVVLVPGVGLLWLLVDGLWMLLDAEGRVLHDRLLGAAVVRDRWTARECVLLRVRWPLIHGLVRRRE